MFCELIKDARLRSGLSQEELGRRIGVTGQAVGQWENGATLPRGFHVQRLVTELGMDPVEVLASIPAVPDRRSQR